MSVNEKELLSMLKFVNESDYGYLSLEDGDFELTVVKKDMDLSDLKDILTGHNKSNEKAFIPHDKNKVPEINEVRETEDAEKVVEQSEVKEELIAVKAPMVGTFFSKPSPEEDDYVKVGDVVESDSTVCLIEVMKLFNSVPAAIHGEIKEVLVKDGELVEYNQPMFLIKQINNARNQA